MTAASCVVPEIDYGKTIKPRPHQEREGILQEPTPLTKNSEIREADLDGHIQIVSLLTHIPALQFVVDELTAVLEVEARRRRDSSHWASWTGRSCTTWGSCSSSRSGACRWGAGAVAETMVGEAVRWLWRWRRGARGERKAGRSCSYSFSGLPLLPRINKYE